MAGISPILIALPLCILVASIALQGNTYIGGVGITNTVCNPNLAPHSCLTNNPVTFTCDLNIWAPLLVPCGVKDPTSLKQLTCPANPPPPSYCSPGLFGFAAGTWLLPRGSSIVVNASQIQASSSGVVFGFGNIDRSGFIIVFGAIMGIVCLAGITIFGTAFVSLEAVHILFMGGALAGLWIFLSGLDGFLGNGTTSLFAEMNSKVISMGGIPIGTSLYIFLTFLYFVGFISMVKRG